MAISDDVLAGTLTVTSTPVGPLAPCSKEPPGGSGGSSSDEPTYSYATGWVFVEGASSGSTQSTVTTGQCLGHQIEVSVKASAGAAVGPRASVGAGYTDSSETCAILQTSDTTSELFVKFNFKRADWSDGEFRIWPVSMGVDWLVENTDGIEWACASGTTSCFAQTTVTGTSGTGFYETTVTQSQTVYLSLEGGWYTPLWSVSGKVVVSGSQGSTFSLKRHFGPTTTEFYEGLYAGNYGTHIGQYGVSTNEPYCFDDPADPWSPCA